MARGRSVKFAKLDNGAWGIRVDQFPKAIVEAGDRVTVTKRDTTTAEVVVEEVLTRERGGAVAYCTIARKGRKTACVPVSKPDLDDYSGFNRGDAEYARGRNDTRVAQMAGPAGSAAREAAYLDMEAQWQREGFDG